MAYTRKERPEPTTLPKGAITVSQYAKNAGCSYTNIFKQADKGKVSIVRFCGVLFVLPKK